MKCVIGLGNPGRRYALTRHNVGFMVLHRVSQKLKIKFTDMGFSAIARGTVPCSVKGLKSVEVLLAKPGVYMNRSGVAVAELLTDFPIEMQDILVIHDDMDIPFGAVRFKRGGSSGGHKGVQSIIDAFRDNTFARLKIGIGRPDNCVDPAEYVLSEFTEKESLSLIVETAACAVIKSLICGIDQAMNRYHGNLVFGEIETT